ncbi:MAG: hypothetical protein RSB55_04470, partial [Oscillospiraceae bacterium]
ESYDDLKAKLTQLKRSNPNMDWDKVRNSVEKFRGIYNDLFEQMNATRIANGYEPVDYRAGYFPHFQKRAETASWTSSPPRWASPWRCRIFPPPCDCGRRVIGAAALNYGVAC